MRRRFPLHLHISVLFVALILLVGLLIGGLGYRFSHDMLESLADDLVERISQDTCGELGRIFSPVQMAVNLLGQQPALRAGPFGAGLEGIGFIRTALDHSDVLSSLYVGYPNGDFLFVRRVSTDAERAGFDAPDGTAYIAQIIAHGERDHGEYRHFDADLNLLRIDARPDYARQYDPRQRDWYRDALARGAAIQTAPYVFFSNHKVGTTLAAPAPAVEGAVVGADILLETLSVSIAAQKITPRTEIALLDENGFVIAHEASDRLVGRSDADDRPSLRSVRAFGIPILAATADTLHSSTGDATDRRMRLNADDETWRVSVQTLAPNGTRLYLVIAIPESELLASAFATRDASVWITLLIVLLSVPATWGIARAVSGPLRALAHEADAIRRFEFSQPIGVQSIVKEVHELATTMEGMKRTIRRFLDITDAVAGEQDFDRLLPRLLSETVSAVSADAGVLYLADDHRLTPAIALSGGEFVDKAQLMPIDRAAPSGTAQRALAGSAVETFRMTVNERRSLGLTAMPEAAEQAIAVPLQNRNGDVVGAMLLLRTEAVEDALLGFVDALSGSAAVSLESQELIKCQRALFESFVQVIASAIDAKSPYTGGHCSRVPELAKMLARAACEATDGPYRDFDLDDKGWEAVHLAGWLHDCGKVTTPEYVVDKATKLETIHDRIHEVRMRFEVLKRDAEIACLKAIAGGEPEAGARARLATEQAALDSDFAFVADCNVGSEYMAPERVERLQSIASRTWLRTLDDRIGISYEERQRKARVPAAPLPVIESLLADKPEHRFERRENERFGDDNPWGFRLQVPQWLYDRGELHNLSVSYGTLTEEDRYKINEHIVQTEIMLRRLNYPRHLRNVPEIAASHHEKMDGTGYPKRLTGDAMSPVARMMAIADIFEALTAVDRPYKQGKTLSESIAIMARMRDERHIDGELFELFLRGGVYRAYAERYMQPEQIDAVDVEAVLGHA